MSKTANPLKRIPPPELVRNRLAAVRREADALEYLLKVSEEVAVRMKAAAPTRSEASSV